MDKFSSEQVEYPEIEQVRDLNSIGTTASSSVRSDEAEASRNIFDNTRRSTVTHPSEYIQQHHGFTVLGLQDQQQRTAGSSYGVASTSTQRPQFSNLRSVDHDPAAARHEMNIPLFKLEESFELRSAARPPQHDTWTEHQSHHERQQQWEQDLSSQRIAATKQEIINDTTMALSGFTSFLNPIGAAQQQASSSAAQPAAASTSSGDEGDQHWAPNLLLECARAIATSDTPRVQNLMWVLNELASPYGDYDQRLASYFLQALFCRITNTGARCHSILSAAAEKTHTFESVRKMILTYQEASPWTTFGHVAGNGAMMEAFEGEMKIHIVDISVTFCTQWPMLFEALATRAEGTPHLRLTIIVISKQESAMEVMRQIMTRLERFARLMGVPFEFTLIQKPQLETLEIAELKLREDEALAINCIHTLHHVPETIPDDKNHSPRDIVLYTFKDANPKIITIVEDEVDLVSSQDFFTSFREALRYYSLLFESLEESFPRASNDRLTLERTCARNMVNLLACDPSENEQRQEPGSRWATRFQTVGLLRSPFSDDVVDDVRALLKRYKEGWGLASDESGLFLTWKMQVAIFASSWKPNLEASHNPTRS
ncbi:unnamed protein product [Sphagnum jensenii]|uniref:Uncharacterized protein n=1 Tax=Sphagnum jensenii TaxID=128206 RepID=A0ABP1BVQ0_9BRYO